MSTRDLFECAVEDQAPDIFVGMPMGRDAVARAVGADAEGEFAEVAAAGFPAVGLETR